MLDVQCSMFKVRAAHANSPRSKMPEQSEKPEQLRILFDVGILGDAFQDNLAKTGIARVAESLLQALAHRADVMLFPVTFSGNDYACQRFLEREADLQTLDLRFLCEPGWCRPLITLFSQLEFSCRKAQFSANHATKGFLCKTLKNLFKTLKQSLARVDRRKRDLSKTDTWHYISIAGCPSNKLLKIDNVKVGVFIHDTIPLTHKQFCKEKETAPWYLDLIRAAQAVEYVFCNSQNTRDDLLRAESGINPTRVHIIPMAAKSHFRPPLKPIDADYLARRYGIPRNSPFALSVCTLEPRKNLATLVQAYQLHLEDNPDSDLDLVLAGATGWKVDQFMQQLNAKSASNARIHLTGFIDEDDLPGLYSLAEFFVYPSFYEGFGLPVIEAMQCGLPVICSNTSSLPEAGGSAAFYISPTDAAALASALTSMHGQPELRRRHVEKSKAQAAKFSWTTSASELVQALRSGPEPQLTEETRALRGSGIPK
mgnify:CR=1 FL=1